MLPVIFIPVTALLLWEVCTKLKFSDCFNLWRPMTGFFSKISWAQNSLSDMADTSSWMAKISLASLVRYWQRRSSCCRTMAIRRERLCKQFITDGSALAYMQYRNSWSVFQQFWVWINYILATLKGKGDCCCLGVCHNCYDLTLMSIWSCSITS